MYSFALVGIELCLKYEGVTDLLAVGRFVGALEKGL